MSYDNIDDPDLLKNITLYKEFYQLHPDTNEKKCIDNGVVSSCYIDKQMALNDYIIPKSYQTFGKTFINPNTEYKRLLIKHNTGSGKTAHALGIAMEFIDIYQHETSVSVQDIGSVFIMGFESSKRAFERELFRYAEFGFVSREDVRLYTRLLKAASSLQKSDVHNLNEFTQHIRRRLSNRKNRGFFKFMGYKTFSNRLFITSKNISGMREDDIRELIESGDIKLNMPLLDSFKNSLIICDEIHNIYNSLYKNNWGVAIQLVLDMVPTVRAVFLSATPINNSPTESVDIINLLVPPQSRIKRSDIFDNHGKPKPGGIDTLTKMSIGRISYLMNVDPQYFPSQTFLGESVDGIPYLKFILCPMSPLHKRTLDAATASGNISIDGQYVLDAVFPPIDGDIGIYKSGDISNFHNQNEAWLNKMGIVVNKRNNTLSGPILHLDNLKQYSSKYFQVMTDLIEIIKTGKGKTFIYHPLVNVTGVLFISEILLQNGILGEHGTPAQNTLCSRCGIAHFDKKADSHEFNPTRFILIHSGIDGQHISRSLERYNSPRNAFGDDIMVLIGSRIMQESREVKNTENIMITHKPDNISALIQIKGRAVRTNSHLDLPPSRHNVNISIYVLCQSDGLTYEELKYKEKVEEYQVIQQIEKRFHEVAIDATINYPINKTTHNTQSSGIGDLKFTPKYPFKPIPLKDMRLSTFTVYHAQKEIEYIIYVIKRLFIEKSQAWTYELLWNAIRSSEYNIPILPKTFSEDNFVIALNRLVMDDKKSVIINDSTQNKRKFLDRLFDHFDNRIMLPSGVLGHVDNYGVIVQLDIYYILFPIVNNTISINVDTPYRIFSQVPQRYINVQSYIKQIDTSSSYSDKRLKFKNTYEHAGLQQMGNLVCEFGVDFHHRFIEECVEYIFNIWTNPRAIQTEYHEFYFKILYYYNIIGVIIWANTPIGNIVNKYKDYLLEGLNVDTQLPSSVQKGECSWCPNVTHDLYESSLSSTLEKFKDQIKNPTDATVIKVSPATLPIGHLLKRTPRFYLPSGWFTESYEQNRKWVENDIIIGYGERSKSGLHIRFKLRPPLHKITTTSDIRSQQKGTICKSINRTKLLKIASLIGVKLPSKFDVSKLCDDIQSQLLRRELDERSKNTNIKWYYQFYETQPTHI